MSDIQNYSSVNIFKCIIKKHKTVTDNLPIRINVNQIEDKITVRIKTGYYLKHLTPETMELLGSIKSK